MPACVCLTGYEENVNRWAAATLGLGTEVSNRELPPPPPAATAAATPPAAAAAAVGGGVPAPAGMAAAVNKGIVDRHATAAAAQPLQATAASQAAIGPAVVVVGHASDTALAVLLSTASVTVSVTECSLALSFSLSCDDGVPRVASNHTPQPTSSCTVHVVTAASYETVHCLIRLFGVTVQAPPSSAGQPTLMEEEFAVSGALMALGVCLAYVLFRLVWRVVGTRC